MIALVFLFKALGIAPESIKPFASVSTKTGFAPTTPIARVVAAAEISVVITSSPSPVPKDISAIWSASSPLPTPMQCLMPRKSANFSSKLLTSFPKINTPELITAAIASSIFFRYRLFLMVRSLKTIFFMR